MNIKPKEIKSKIDWVFITNILLICGVCFMVALCSYKTVRYDCERDPLEEGSHLNYTITCENGFKYKILSDRRGVIQLLGKDGKPLKCN